jgi:hypothetical protein
VKALDVGYLSDVYHSHGLSALMRVTHPAAGPTLSNGGFSPVDSNQHAIIATLTTNTQDGARPILRVVGEANL